MRLITNRTTCQMSCKTSACWLQMLSFISGHMFFFRRTGRQGHGRQHQQALLLTSLFKQRLA
jgi:hypothetical protein